VILVCPSTNHRLVDQLDVALLTVGYREHRNRSCLLGQSINAMLLWWRSLPLADQPKTASSAQHKSLCPRVLYDERRNPSGDAAQRLALNGQIKDAPPFANHTTRRLRDFRSASSEQRRASGRTSRSPRHRTESGAKRTRAGHPPWCVARRAGGGGGPTG
jgi:hypothetical protein